MSAGGGANPPPIKWRCVNKHKNEPLVALFYCTWSGKEFTVPAKAKDVDADYYFIEDNGVDEGVLFGSTTLKDTVKRWKAREPTLFLMEESGGIEAHCGTNTVCSSE